MRTSTSLGITVPSSASTFFDRPSPIGFEIVPVGGQPQDLPRVAGAERANEDIMNLVCVLNDHKLGILEKADAKLFTGCATVSDKPRAKLGINPSSCY